MVTEIKIINMETDLKDLDTKLSNHHRVRSIKLSFEIFGPEQNYYDSRMTRDCKYEIMAHEDSLGTAKRNILSIFLSALDMHFMENDNVSHSYGGLSGVHLIHFMNPNGDWEEILPANPEEIRIYLTLKLISLQIGQKLELSFCGDSETVIRIDRVD